MVSNVATEFFCGFNFGITVVVYRLVAADHVEVPKGVR